MWQNLITDTIEKLKCTCKQHQGFICNVIIRCRFFLFRISCPWNVSNSKGETKYLLKHCFSTKTLCNLYFIFLMNWFPFIFYENKVALLNLKGFHILCILFIYKMISLFPERIQIHNLIQRPYVALNFSTPTHAIGKSI